MDWSLAVAGLSLLVSISTAVGPALFRKMFRRPKLRFHKSGRIHVVFGPFGPGLQLMGTIQAVNAPQFLSSIEVDVYQPASNKRHTLVWRLTFPEAFLSDPGGNSKADMPVGVMINPQQAYRFQAFFNSSQAEDSTIREIKSRLQSEWVNQMAAMVAQAHNDSPEAVTRMTAQATEVRNASFRLFMDSHSFAWAKKKLRSAMFWNAGAYQLTVRIRTAEPDGSYEDHWRFELTEENIRALEFNTEFALAELAGLPGMGALYSGCIVDYLTEEG